MQRKFGIAVLAALIAAPLAANAQAPGQRRGERSRCGTCGGSDRSAQPPGRRRAFSAPTLRRVSVTLCWANTARRSVSMKASRPGARLPLSGVTYYPVPARIWRRPALSLHARERPCRAGRSGDAANCAGHRLGRSSIWREFSLKRRLRNYRKALFLRTASPFRAACGQAEVLATPPARAIACRANASAWTAISGTALVSQYWPRSIGPIA